MVRCQIALANVMIKRSMVRAPTGPSSGRADASIYVLYVLARAQPVKNSSLVTRHVLEARSRVAQRYVSLRRAR